jgi:putative transcriptional regulator
MTMSKNLQDALKETVQDIVNSGLPTTFTKKQLDELGVKLPTIKMNAKKISRIRKSMRLSQAVFAQLLNVSVTSVRHWEQGVREPSGSTKVLLDLLSRNPHALDYLLPKQLIAA